MIRILVIGDVVGKAGRKCLQRGLEEAKKKFSYEAIIINGENAAGGFGLTKKIYDQFIEKLGIDCITMGNHWPDKPEIKQFINQVENIALPANMNNVEHEELGLRYISKHGIRIAVINLIGRAYMNPDNRCPFKTVENLLTKIPESVKIKIVDMHAEATSEKQAMGQFLAGRVSLVFGTHIHVPTADERILAGYTGFITDLGMVGSYDSVIGIDKRIAIARFVLGEKRPFEPAKKDPWFSALVVDFDEYTGACQSIERICWRGYEG